MRDRLSATLRSLRHGMLQLALVAMALRALLPTGWMPNPDAGSHGVALTICTDQGLRTIHLDGTGKSQPRDDQGQDHWHDVCPFAAAAHWAFGPVAPVPLMQDRTVFAVDAPRSEPAFFWRPVVTAHGPRAPPSLS